MKSIIVIAIIWVLGCGVVNAENIKNRFTILSSGYVEPIEGREFLPGARTDGSRKVASTISLIEGEGIILIADPGMAAPGVWDGILNQLQSKGIEPENITHVFISHHHPDHVTQLGLFPNATLVDFWAVYKDDIWSDHPDNYELAPGIKVILTPGHTNEDASLPVEGGRDLCAYAFVVGAGLFTRERPVGGRPGGHQKVPRVDVDRSRLDCSGAWCRFQKLSPKTNRCGVKKLTLYLPLNAFVVLFADFVQSLFFATPAMHIFNGFNQFAATKAFCFPKILFVPALLTHLNP